MYWNNDGASDSGYTRKKKETPITLPSASAFPPQLDGPAIIVYGPTPERADLGCEVLVPYGNKVEAQLEVQQRRSVNVLTLVAHAGLTAMGPVDVVRGKIRGLWIVNTMLVEETVGFRWPRF